MTIIDALRKRQKNIRLEISKAIENVERNRSELTNQINRKKILEKLQQNPHDVTPEESKAKEKKQYDKMSSLPDQSP